MSIPVQYPDPSCIDTLRGRVHNPELPLINSKPKDTWQPGGIVWVYNQDSHRIVPGVILTACVAGDTWHATVQDLAVADADYGKDQVIVGFTELFETKEALLQAFFTHRED